MKWEVSNLKHESVTVTAGKFSEAIAEAIKSGLIGSPDSWYVRVVAA